MVAPPVKTPFAIVPSPSLPTVNPAFPTILTTLNDAGVDDCVNHLIKRE
jgi:hypothetical protein